MKLIATRSRAHILAKRRSRAREAGLVPRRRSGSGRYIVVVTPRLKRDKPYCAECSEREYAKLVHESLRVEILWQSHITKRAGEKDYSSSGGAPSSIAAYSVFRAELEIE